MLSQLREAGVDVSENIEDNDYGKFGWAIDPEDNRIELWQQPHKLA
jgi:predicted enzyme related to lactoylglutathione lyase